MIVRFLHLSDFHLKGQENPVEEFNQNHVTRSLAEKVESIVEEGEAFDFVVVTGDLAFGGNEKDYAVVKVVCERILKAAGLAPERLFLVPGNHDVDRDKINSLYLKLYPCDSHDDILERVFDEGFRANLMAKFSAFHKFAEKATGIRRYDRESFHYAQNLRLEKDGKESSINLLGLNSAILAGYDGDDDRKLALGSFQVNDALSKIDRSAHLTLAFFHHPFSCFHGCDRESRNLLVRNVDMILTGHSHNPENAFYHDSAGKVVHIGAGASYEKRESENVFDIVEIDLEKRSGIVQFYEYVHEHRAWVKNNRVNPFEEDGAFKFQLGPLAGSDQDENGEESADAVESALPKKRPLGENCSELPGQSSVLSLDPSFGRFQDQHQHPNSHRGYLYPAAGHGSYRLLKRFLIR